MRRDWRTWSLVALGLGVVGVVAYELKLRADRDRERRRHIAELDARQAWFDKLEKIARGEAHGAPCGCDGPHEFVACGAAVGNPDPDNCARCRLEDEPVRAECAGCDGGCEECR